MTIFGHAKELLDQHKTEFQGLLSSIEVHYDMAVKWDRTALTLIADLGVLERLYIYDGAS